MKVSTPPGSLPLHVTPPGPISGTPSPKSPVYPINTPVATAGPSSLCPAACGGEPRTESPPRLRRSTRRRPSAPSHQVCNAASPTARTRVLPGVMEPPGATEAAPWCGSSSAIPPPSAAGAAMHSSAVLPEAQQVTVEAAEAASAAAADGSDAAMALITPPQKRTRRGSCSSAATAAARTRSSSSRSRKAASDSLEADDEGHRRLQSSLHPPQPAAPRPFRCVADLELAVAHLRARDTKLVPLIDTHGLPYSLLSSTAAAVEAGVARSSPRTAGVAATDSIHATATAAAAATTSLAAAAGVYDPSLGCGKGSNSAAADGDAAAGSAVCNDGWDGRGGAAAVADSSPWGGSGGCRSVFAALARSVVYQQLATKAASAIWSRVVITCKASTGDQLTPLQVLSAPPDQLRAAGLSARKLEYLSGLAAAFAARQDWDEQLAGTLDMGLLVSELTALRGIGTWTVHMLAMFHLGLPDVLPTGDLGVRRGLQLLHGMSKLPEPSQVEAMTESWRPYRSVGSWYMWRIPPPSRTSSRTAATTTTKEKKKKTMTPPAVVASAAKNAGASGDT